jgi:leucyl/phenylalanyl-tRNA--protein transferase
MNGEMHWERVGHAAAERGLPVAVGGSVAPHRLLEAHRHGCFPYARHFARPHGPAGCGRYARQVARGLVFAFPPDEAAGGPEVTWWSPPRRPVLPVASRQFGGGLLQSPDCPPAWIVTCDHAFPSIVERCRDLAGCDWITDPLRSSQLALNRAGWAHSIEVWEGDRLIAGLFGTGMGRVFSVDAAFGDHPGAVRVAFADLSRRLDSRAELIDVQVDRGYGDFLELESISRDRYVEAVHAVDLPPVIRDGVLAVRPADAER